VIRFRALVTEDADSLVSGFTTDDAVALAGSFIPALVTEPVAIWDVIHGWPEAVGVIAFVTSVA
jgi:hypothetical protein